MQTKFTSFFSLKKSCACLFLFVFVFYLGNIHNAFNPDASTYLSGERIKYFSSLWDYFCVGPGQHYAPLNNLVNVNIFQWWGNDPFPYRAINNLLLGFVSVLVALLIYQLTNHKLFSFVTSLVWALHPFTAEMMNHVTMNIIWIMMIFILGSLLSYLHYIKHPEQKSFLIVSLLFHIGAVLSQELGILLPLYLGAILWQNKKVSFPEAFIRMIPFMLISCVYFWIWKNIANSTAQLDQRMFQSSTGLFEYCATLFMTTSWYLKNLFFPTDVVFIYNQLLVRENLLLPNIGFFLCVGLYFYLLFQWRNSIKGLGLLFFGINMIIVGIASFAHPHMGLVMEPYWLVFGSMGLYLCIASILIDMTKRQQLPLLRCALYFLPLCLLAFTYMRIGQTTYTHSKFWYTHTHENYVATSNYANALAQQGQLQEALRLFLLINEHTNKSDPPVLSNIATIYNYLGEAEKSITYFEKVLESDPGYVFALHQLGVLYAKDNQLPQASRLIAKALDQTPEDPQLLILYGEITANRGLLQKGIDIWTAGKEIAPNYSLEFEKRIDKARKLLEKS